MQFLKRRYHNTRIILGIIFGMVFLLAGCHTGASSLSGSTATTNDVQPKIVLTSADLETICKSPNYIDLNQFSDEKIVISEPGCHVLSGEINGSIQIDVEDQIIHLVLNGVTVDSPYGPALEVLSAGKVFLTLQEGSENVLTDGAVYPETQDPDACIYSACDMTINGSGTLHVYGYYKDAIHSKDVLKILDGTIFAQSKRNGLRGNDGIVVNCGSLNVQSEKNGLQTTKFGNDGKGNIEIYDSACSIIGGNYGISCTADLYIADSSIYVMGILEDIEVDGVSQIEEGNLQDE